MEKAIVEDVNYVCERERQKERATDRERMKLPRERERKKERKREGGRNKEKRLWKKERSKKANFKKSPRGSAPLSLLEPPNYACIDEQPPLYHRR